MTDTFSHFNNNKNFENLTFDIANNKVLANMGIQGGLKNVTVYRDSYFAACDPVSGWPGVWTAKDNSSFGSYTTVFVNRFLGISYDALNEKFSFAPLSVIGDFSWNDFPIGNQRFTVSCKYERGKVHASFQNPNQTGKHLEVMLPMSASAIIKVKVNGQILKVWQKVDDLEVPANGSVEIEILN